MSFLDMDTEHRSSSSQPTNKIGVTGFIQASLGKVQGLFKNFSRLSYSFQGLKFKEKS